MGSKGIVFLSCEKKEENFGLSKNQGFFFFNRAAQQAFSAFFFFGLRSWFWTFLGINLVRSLCSADQGQRHCQVGSGENSQRHARTAALPIGSDGLPSQAATSVPDAALIPHPELNLAMGSDPSVYGFVKFETRRNIYRIPLHN